jgi:hypothetical protein
MALSVKDGLVQQRNIRILFLYHFVKGIVLRDLPDVLFLFYTKTISYFLVYSLRKRLF